MYCIVLLDVIHYNFFKYEFDLTLFDVYLIFFNMDVIWSLINEISLLKRKSRMA